MGKSERTVLTFSTERYTCSFTRQQLDRLRAIAHAKSKKSGKQVSVADLIRSAINRTYGGKYEED